MSPSAAPQMPLTATRGHASQRELALCAVADDGVAMDVIATGAHLAAAGRVELVFVHIAEPADVLPTAHAAIIGGASAERLGQLRDDALERGDVLMQQIGLGGAHTHVEVGTLAARQLRDVARKLGASLIVVGPGPRGPLRRAFRYSVTQQLLRDAAHPLVMARSARELEPANGPVVAALAAGWRAAHLGARWGARLALVLDRPLVLARVGRYGRWRADGDALASLAPNAHIEAVVALADRTELGDLADDLQAAALAVPYPGTLGRVVGRGRLARGLLAHCRAPIAMLPPALPAPASHHKDLGPA